MRIETTPSGRFFNYRGFILVVVFALVIWLNLSFLKPLVMGAIFATVLHPLMKKFDRWEKSKKWSDTSRAAIVTFAFTVTLLIPVGVLLWMGAEAALDKAQSLHGSVNLTNGSLSPNNVIDTLGLRPILDRVTEFAPIDEAQVKQYAMKGATAVGGLVVKTLQGLLASLPGIIFQNIVIIFTIFFLLIDGPKAVQFFRHNSIFNETQTDKLIHATSLLCNSVIVATVVSGAVQAVLVALGCIFTGAGNPVLWGFITFIASFFPVVGTTPVTLFLAIQAFASGDNTTGIVFLILMPVVGTSDNIVRPYVLKGGAELHPLIGFVAAFGALDAIGFYGLFIGPIVAGLFFVLLPMVTKTYPRVPRRL